MIEIVWDASTLKVWRNARVDAAILWAARRAGSDAIRKARTAAKAKIKKRKRMKQRRVQSGLPLTFPAATSKLGDLIWRMGVSGETVPLGEYPSRQTKSGVKLEVNVGEPERLKHAFIATLKSGHRSVFQRSGKKRLPIEELFTTRLSDVASDTGFMPDVAEAAQKEFLSTFDRLLTMRLARA
jgi:hypothetical protein